MTYEILARDNTCNSENTFDREWIFSIYGPAGADWCWEHDVYVAVTLHNGGDPRGNYGATKLYRADSLGEIGFLDWVHGWSVRRFNGFDDVELEDLTAEQANQILAEAESDDRLNNRCCPGYSSYPAGELSRESTESDSCIWHNGQAILKTDNGWIIAEPYHYQADVETPDNGSGWLSDAMIDREDFFHQMESDNFEEIELPEDFDQWDNDLEDFVNNLVNISCD